MSYVQKEPFTDVVVKTKVILSGGINQMISRVPWQPGSQKYYTLRKVVATTPPGLSGSVGSVVTLWDQDLSSATPAVRGNASTGALITLAVQQGVGLSGGSNTVVLGLNECPRERFEAGICAQASLVNTAIMLELELN